MVSPIYGIMMCGICCLYMVHGIDAFHNVKRLTGDIIYAGKLPPETDSEYVADEGPIIIINDLFPISVATNDIHSTERAVIDDTTNKSENSKQVSKSNKFPSPSRYADYYSTTKTQGSDSDITNSPDALPNQFTKIYLKCITDLIQHIMNMFLVTNDSEDNNIIIDESPNVDCELSPSRKLIEKNTSKRDIESSNNLDLNPVNIKSSSIRKVMKRDISNRDSATSSGNSASNGSSIINSGSSSQITPHMELKSEGYKSNIATSINVSEGTSTGISSMQSTLKNNYTTSTEGATIDNKKNTSSFSNQQGKVSVESPSNTMNNITVTTSIKIETTETVTKNDTFAPKKLLPADDEGMIPEITIHLKPSHASSKNLEIKTEVPENLLSVSALINEKNTLLMDAKTLNGDQQFELRMPEEHLDSDKVQRSIKDAKGDHVSNATTASAIAGTFMLVVIFVFAACAVTTLLRKRNNQEQTGNQTASSVRNINA